MSVLDSISNALTSTKVTSVVNQAMNVFDAVKKSTATQQTTVAAPVPQNTTVSNVDVTKDKTMLYVGIGVGVVVLILLLK